LTHNSTNVNGERNNEEKRTCVNPHPQIFFDVTDAKGEELIAGNAPIP